MVPPGAIHNHPCRPADPGLNRRSIEKSGQAQEAQEAQRPGDRTDHEWRNGNMAGKVKGPPKPKVERGGVTNERKAKAIEDLREIGRAHV